MLAWFRRHAKILMVVLGSSAMAIFGLGPVFDTLASRGGGSDAREKEVVASWKGGDITRVDLDKMQIQHSQAQRFLMAVQQAAEKKKGDVVNPLVIPISPIQDGKQEMVDDQLITRFLMAERAKEEGMIVSDDMVNEYIALLSDDAGFSKRDLDEINDAANNRYCSFNSVRERLKVELLANQMQLCCMTAVPLIPNPIESMELYGRTMEQIECEVLPIEIEKYVAKVDGNPTAAEIKKLFEAGKYEFPDPTGDRPGFKIGRKVNLQYFVADYQTYLQNEMNKLSDEDVQKEYERLIEAMDEMVLEPLPVDDGSIDIKGPPPTDSEVDAPPTTGEMEGKTDPSGEAPGDVTPPPAAETESPTTEEVKKPEAGKSEGDETETGKTEGEKSEPEKSDEEKSDEEKSDDDQSDDGSTEEEKGDGDQAFNVNNSKLQFVSTAIQEAAPQDQETTGQEATDSKKPDPADASQEGAETGPETQEPAGVQPVGQDPTATEEKAGDAKPGDQEPAETGESKQEVDPGSIDPGSIDAIMKDVANDAAQEETKVDRVAKPLKDVVEDVKRSMSEEAANKAMNEALTKASVLVQAHFELRLRWEFDNSNKKTDEPEPLDFEAVAAKYNLIAKETGLVDDLEIANDQCAQVRMFLNYMIQGRQTPQLVPVGQLIFNNFGDLNLFEAQQVNDNWGSKSSFLYWLAEKVDTRVPTLKEAEPKIIEFWKSQKARELALAEAKSISEKVNQSGGKMMSELYADRVSKTGAFTWFSSFGSTGYSEPMGVKVAGEDFMRTAFGLENLKSGVAVNELRDTVYVVQSLSDTKTIEELGTEYLDEQFFKFKRIPNEVQRVSQLYFQEFNLNWNQEFKDTMGLKFMDR